MGMGGMMGAAGGMGGGMGGGMNAPNTPGVISVIPVVPDQQISPPNKRVRGNNPAAPPTKEQAAVSQALQAEVQNQVNSARAQMANNPAGAVQSLRGELDKIRQMPDLPPQARAQMATAIGAAMRDVLHRQVEFEHNRQGNAERLAEAKESAFTVAKPAPAKPQAAAWADRKGSMSLAKQGSSEKRIEAALKSPTKMEFVETPLRDVIDYLEDYHQIVIQLDESAMDSAGVSKETPVTKNIKGVALAWRCTRFSKIITLPTSYRAR